jgi:hypothetical protein
MTDFTDRAEAEAKKLWAVKSWKEQAIIGGICILVLILLDTGLVEVTVSILKILLFIVGVVYLVRAAITSYPIWSKKLDR